MAENTHQSIASWLSSWKGNSAFADGQTSQIRDRITEHIDHTSHRSRWQHIGSRKRTLAGGVVAGIASILYGLWGLPLREVLYENDDFRLVRSGPTVTDRVMASGVGRILQSDGEYTITNDDVTYRTNIIYDGDTIQLHDGSRLTFDVGGHEASVLGPALIGVSRADGGYRFVVYEGEFLEVSSQGSLSGSRLEVSMKDVMLSHYDTESTMRVELSIDKSGDTVIKNYADDVLVRREGEREAIVQSQTQVTVSDDSSLDDAMAAAFSLSDIEYVATVDYDDAVSTPLAMEEDVFIASVISSGTELVIQEGDSVDIAIAARVSTGDVALVDDLLLPRPAQLQVLHRLVDGASVLNVRSSFQSLFGCDIADMDDAVLCVGDIMSRYYLPPSLVQDLGGWMGSASSGSSSGDSIDSVLTPDTDSDSQGSWGVLSGDILGTGDQLIDK